MKKLIYIENDFHPEHLYSIKNKLLNATVLNKERIDTIETFLAFGNHYSHPIILYCHIPNIAAKVMCNYEC